MRLPFQRDRTDPTLDVPRDARRGARGGAEAAADPVDAIAAARLKARRRLIGAAVLLAAGVIGFPLLFETEPRPLPANLPIITAQGEVTRPGAAPRGTAPRENEGTPAPARGDAGVQAGALSSAPAAARERAREPAPEAAQQAASAAPSAPAEPTTSAAPRPPQAVAAASAPAAAQRPVPAPPAERAAPPPAAPVPAAAERTAKPPAADPPAAEGRFVVQIGAYADQATLRDTRQKVEKLGLKTYTQVIDSDAGRRTRVRVGPFDTRAEAQAAAAKLKAAGLPAALLTL